MDKEKITRLRNYKWWHQNGHSATSILHQSRSRKQPGSLGCCTDACDQMPHSGRVQFSGWLAVQLSNQQYICEDKQRWVEPPTGSSSRLLHTLVSVFWCITCRIVNNGASALQPPFTLSQVTVQQDNCVHRTPRESTITITAQLTESWGLATDEHK